MSWFDPIIAGAGSLKAADVGSIMQGAGALAGAWGNFEADKQRNKFLQEQMNYEKKKDQYAQGKLDKAQASLDDAFDNSVLNPNKKKKNPATTDITDPLAVSV